MSRNEFNRNLSMYTQLVCNINKRTQPWDITTLCSRGRDLKFTEESQKTVLPLAIIVQLPHTLCTVVFDGSARKSERKDNEWQEAQRWYQYNQLILDRQQHIDDGIYWAVFESLMPSIPTQIASKENIIE